MSDVDFGINDDLNVDENYETVDTTPKPPLPGNYLVKPLTWEFAKVYGTDELAKWKNADGVPTYPLFQLNMVEITDPFECVRRVGLFQNVPTAPQERDGKRVSKAADLLTSLRPDAHASGTNDVIRQVAEALDGQTEFRVRIDYAGYDSEFAKSQIARAGGKDNLDRKALNNIYKAAKIQGWKKIQQDNRSRNKGNLPLHKWAGPSGEVVTVKPIITIFYPANDPSVRLGPDKTVTS